MARSAAKSPASCWLFDALVTAVTRSGSGGPPAIEFAAYGKLDEVLPRADAVVLALPLAADTRHVIDRERLALMKPDALLVNVGQRRTGR